MPLPEASPLIAFAQHWGPHALPVFLVGLLVAVVASGLAGMLVHLRQARRSETAEDGPPTVARLLASYATGFVLIVGAALLFAAMARQIGPGHAMGLADQALTDAIALHVPAVALRAFGVLTHLGDPLALGVLGVVVAVWLWRRPERLLAIGWGVALAGNAMLNPLLKQVFARSRPLHDHGLPLASGYSFPSGHSSGAVVAYGMLLYVALRVLPSRWHAVAGMVATAVVLTTACGRVFLRVHFASDVAAGVLSGLAWLGVCVASLEVTRRHRQP